MNKQLKFLFDEDQYECVNQPPDGTPAYLDLRKRCRDRISQVKELLVSEEALSGDDYFHACIIFMHGDCPDDFWQGHCAALKAFEQNYIRAKQFAAAAYDKWLMYQGRPQKFGTQYVPDGVQLRLWDIDPKTTDDDRVEWEVPVLPELQRNLMALNRTFDISVIDMASKPQWLKDAIVRWNS